MGCPLGPDVEPAAKKTSSRYGLPTLFQPGLPSVGSPHCAHNKPMWASSWAAHLGLTWNPRPKKHPADMGCLYGPHEDAHMGATMGPHGHAGRAQRGDATQAIYD